MRSRFAVLLIATALLVSFTAGTTLAQEPKSLPKREYKASGENFGYIPPPIDLSYLQPPTALLGAPATSWDWRGLGGVTSVKNQNPYGTCWAFATCGDFESKMLINESTTYDFSELNIQACNLTTFHDCNAGGNAWISNNFLSQFGTVTETCDPYPGGCPTPTCNSSCTYLKQIRGWILIPDDVNAIKNAVQTYGPVYTSMYASFAGFGTYDGSYCITYTGTEDTNHAVLIVGWDDDMCGGNGAWIVKNSWGTSWGDNGYFYIQYGSARIGSYCSVITDWVDHDPAETIYYYDEWGWWSSVGWGDGVDWGMIELTHGVSGEELKAVSFSAGNNPTSYNIYIYDNFSGGSLSTLLVGPISGTVADAGYYTVDLPTPLALTSGDPIYIAIQFDTGTYGYPIPYDDTGPMETNKCFVSNDGVSYTALDSGGYAMGDVGIRGIISPEAFEPGDSLSIDQADRYYIEIGNSTGLVPFGLCNPDPEAPNFSYSYEITSPGYSSGGCVIPAINESGTTGSVSGGDCEYVYATVDASNACVGDTASLEIVAWVGTEYDTCVQVVEIIEPIIVPVFSPAMLTVMILGLILLAAIVIKRRAADAA